MARVHRFLGPEIGAKAVLRLDPDESHRMVRVLRLEPGAAVEVFDGAGKAYAARFSAVEADGACRVERGAAVPDREAALRLTAAVALPKADGFTDLCRRLAEIGVATIVPLVTERAEGKASVSRFRRWGAAALAGSRQSGRAVVPAIEPARRFGEWVRAAHPEARWIADLPRRPPAADGAGEELPIGKTVGETVGKNGGGAPVAVGDEAPTEPPGAAPTTLTAGASQSPRQAPTDAAPNPAPNAAVVAIGPEGGFAPGEAAAARRCGFHRLDLGERTLRTPTAAAVAAWLLLHRAAG